MTTPMASRDTIDIRTLRQTWAAFDRVAHLRPIRSEEDYDHTVALMNTLLDAVGDEEEHALSGLLDLVSALVEEYDTHHYSIEAFEPKEVLRYLIEMRGLNQGDLAEIVAQSNLSAILAGKRKISATLAGKLAKYFNVSPTVFVPVRRQPLRQRKLTACLELIERSGPKYVDETKLGLMGDVKPVGEGAYTSALTGACTLRSAARLIDLLAGGSKRTQKSDIERATALAALLD